MMSHWSVTVNVWCRWATKGKVGHQGEGAAVWWTSAAAVNLNSHTPACLPSWLTNYLNYSYNICCSPNHEVSISEKRCVYAQEEVRPGNINCSHGYNAIITPRQVHTHTFTPNKYQVNGVLKNQQTSNWLRDNEPTDINIINTDIYDFTTNQRPSPKRRKGYLGMITWLPHFHFHSCYG